MAQTNTLVPNLDEGRFFYSPILGCSGACSYCYLSLKNYSYPRKNELTIEAIQSIAQQYNDFIWGQNGTIISVGAWGDIFPLHKVELFQHSVQIIKELLSWGNPVQIMSKNYLHKDFVAEIAHSIKYAGQLLYSTTITTIDKWDLIEPGTSDPITRLDVCQQFHQMGIPTNVLLKPFIFKLTGVEIEHISDLLIQYQIDYCTLGIMYLSSEISDKINRQPYFRTLIASETFSSLNHLDCEGDTPIPSTSISNLYPTLHYLQKKGICTFLKSSCVNSNLLRRKNPSNYYEQGNPYCIRCKNCDTCDP